MTEEKTFAGFMPWEAFVAQCGFKKTQLTQTTNGSILALGNGEVIATIHGDLKVGNVHETAEHMAALNLVVGLPKPGSKDQKGRPSLPCIMESQSTWEVVDF